jgi:hypothetical protein
MDVSTEVDEPAISCFLQQMHDIQEGLLPVRAALHPTGLYLALRQIDPSELQDAFLQETIARCPATDTVVQIAREDIGKAARDTAPAGLIFHVARCGSTLISQLLKQRGDIVVYAEPQAVNEILLPPHKWPRHEMVDALRSLGDAFARHARKPYVLKFSSWNTMFCDFLAEAFPQSPWILSLRDPLEVGVSLLRQSPGWLQGSQEASRALMRFVDPDVTSKSPEELIGRLYGKFCEAACRLDANRGRLVFYETLPAAVWELVAPHFALSTDDPQRQRMAQAARFNSKAAAGRSTEFASDAAAKQAAATAALRLAIDTFARPQLERLVGLHAARKPVRYPDADY